MKDAFGAWSITSPPRMLVMLLTFTLLLAVGCNQDRAVAVQELNKGIEAYHSGKSMTAIRHLEEAASLDPTFAEPSLYLGQLYHLEVGELDNAEQAYRQALQRDPDNVDTYYRLGTVLADKEDYSSAAGQFEQAVERDPEHARAWFRLGLSQQAEAEYPEAVDSFMKSIRANPRMKMDEDDRGGAAYHALGDLYTRYGFFDRALKVYENAILNNEGVARLHAGRGVAQLKLERYAEAAKSFQEALELDSGHVPATFNLAVAHNHLGQHDQAMQVLETYLNRSTDQARRSAAQGLLQKLRVAKEEAAE
jgi:tetratricopeptide (TPR) repeat protein